MKRTGLLIVWAILSTIVASAAASAATVNLNMTDQNPETAWGAIHATKPWADQVEKATGGEVKITIYSSQTLTKGKDAWQGVKNGVADIGWCFHGYWPGMTPGADVITMPGLPIKTARQGSEILWTLYEKYPEVRDGFQDNQVLVLFTSTPFFMLTVNKPIKTLEDFKGLKIRTTGGPPTDQIAKLGGVPLSIGMPDCYLALQRGVIDGMGASWESTTAFRLYEVVKYFNYVKLTCVYFSISMNKNKWNSLSQKNRDAIMSVSGLEGSKFWGQNYFDLSREALFDNIKKQNISITEVTPTAQEEQRILETGGKPVWEAWVSDMESKGYKNARTILNTTLSLTK